MGRARSFMLLAFLLALAVLAQAARAQIEVRDDTGRSVRLARPAQRIVSLSPDLTEILFDIGAGGRTVGAVQFSDYPEAARAIPRVGAYDHIDLEAVIALEPDLVLAWQSGNPAGQVAKLKALGLPVYRSQPGRLEDIAASLERLGELTGTAPAARAAAQRFRARLAALRGRYGGRAPVRTFYEVWNEPLMTVGGQQVISDVIRLCGGENVFAALKPMAAAVAVEAVIEANPEAIVASGMGEQRPEWLDAWRRWPALTAVARDNLFFVPPDQLQRHTARILDGAERLCLHLEAARSRRPR